MDTFKWSMEYIDSLRMWEFKSFIELLEARVEKEEAERERAQREL